MSNEAAEAEKPKPAAPRFIGDRPRSRTVTLEWPLEFDGKVYEQIVVRRATLADLAVFAEQLAALPKGQEIHLPMYDAPDAVIDALDPDDRDSLNAAADGFLLRRWLASSEVEPAQATGSSTAPSS